MKYLLKNALIVTPEFSKKGDVAIDGDRISGLWYEGKRDFPGAETIDLSGLVLMAGGIDAHVHFREPGLTSKGDIYTETKAALLGGITSFMDMPNTNPPATTEERILEKSKLARGRSFCNYGFHIGATNSNYSEIRALYSKEKRSFAGVKIFMGSSTGNMLVDNPEALKELFSIENAEILVHSEDENLIKQGMAKALQEYGERIPFSHHPLIRSREACIKSTATALDKAIEAGTRLHLLHITTKEELDLIREAKKHNPRITAETSANYLWFCDEDYKRLGSHIKCNPAVKGRKDREALRQALLDGTIDTIGSDHAPHLLQEKDRPYALCPSGMPSIQQSFPVMLTVAAQEGLSLNRLTELMSEKAANIFGIENRGRIQEGYFADLVAVSPEEKFIVGKEKQNISGAGISYKCGWSPYEGEELSGKVRFVMVNGQIAVKEGRLIDETPHGKALSFLKNG